MPKEPRDDNRVFHIGGGHGDRGEPPVEGPQPTLRPVISPSSVGATLAITREKFGQELKQVAQTLRIRLAYLEAIEDDRHADLPGLTYAVGFVRSYADYLGLDSKLLVERYKDEAQGLNRRTQLVFPTPAAEAKVPTGAIILVALILIGLTYLGWTYFSDDTQPPAVASAPAAPAPAAPALPAPAPFSTGGSATADPASDGGTGAAPAVADAAPTPAPTAVPAPAPAAIPGAAPDNGAAVETATTTPDATAAVASEAPAETAPAAVTGAPAAPPAPPAVQASTADATAATQQAAVPPPLPAAVEQAHQPRLLIKAEQDSWVQIRNAKDEAILTKVLREGESYEVPEEPGLVLLTGNAGGLVVVLDGQPLPPLGPVGSVRRNIALDPELLAPQ